MCEVVTSCNESNRIESKSSVRPKELKRRSSSFELSIVRDTDHAHDID
jgi:hypothetical protein